MPPLTLEMTPFAREMLALSSADRTRHLHLTWKRGELDTDELRAWILPTWQEAEFPARLGHAPWLEMFAATGFVTDEGDEPDYPVTAYRGAPIGRPRGFSWTWDLERAKWFASRLSNYFGDAGTVYRVTLPEDRLLAVIGGTEGRSEHEVIVNPRRLTGRWTPEQVPGFE